MKRKVIQPHIDWEAQENTFAIPDTDDTELTEDDIGEIFNDLLDAYSHIEHQEVYKAMFLDQVQRMTECWQEIADNDADDFQHVLDLCQVNRDELSAEKMSHVRGKTRRTSLEIFIHRLEKMRDLVFYPSIHKMSQEKREKSKGMSIEDRQKFLLEKSVYEMFAEAIGE